MTFHPRHMPRREFLGALGGSAVALETARARTAQSPQSPLPAPSNFAEVPAVNLGDLEAYFTDERLRRGVDTTVPLRDVPFVIVVYNAPTWHPSPFMEKFFGKGWTEFETLKNSKPLYPGHLFPKYPLWGYFNEADPEWAEREIATAADFGIDVWMIDWYWFKGVRFYHEQLEDGFLKAPNRSRLKFAIMWAFEDWKNMYPTRRWDEAGMLARQTTDEDDMMKVIDFCIERYFHQPNYWRIDGRPVFALYGINTLLKFLEADQLRSVFEKMRERVARAGLGDLYLLACAGYEGQERELKILGFDAATHYHTFAGAFGRPPGSRTPYGEAALRSIQIWRDTAAKLSTPYFPNCAVGWDDSPRFGSNSSMVTERSPDQFERLLRAAQYFSAASPAKNKIIFVNSWNEWDEDHVLLPDTIFGYSYLEAVRRVARGCAQPGQSRSGLTASECSNFKSDEIRFARYQSAEDLLSGAGIIEEEL